MNVDELRDSLRAWLDERFELRDPERDDERLDIISRTPDGHEAFVARAREFQGRLADAGFAGVQYPADYGGRGLTHEHQSMIEEELLRYDTPSRRPVSIGLHLAGGTVLAVGTDEQKRRFLPSIINAEELWCQLFSEPNAGSDLVALSTRGRLDGDMWIVDGQKVWSSYASDAQFGLLLVRSDPTSTKPHTGITMLALPMDAPGVEVRPLVDIAGGRHFNEVFLDSVHVPAANMLGPLHGGWSVANGTLGNERSGYRGGSGGGRRKRQVLAAAHSAGGGALIDPVVRQSIVDVIAREQLLDWLGERLTVRSGTGGSVAGGHPGAGSLMKVAAGNLEQQVSELVMNLRGYASLAWDATDRDGDVAAHAINASRQATVAGGTHQIQRNLIGERVLGLPR